MSRIPAAATTLTITDPRAAWVKLQDMHDAGRHVRELAEAAKLILNEMHASMGEAHAKRMAKATATVAAELASSIASFGIGIERDVIALDGLLSTSLMALDQAPGSESNAGTSR